MNREQFPGSLWGEWHNMPREVPGKLGPKNGPVQELCGLHFVPEGLGLGSMKKVRVSSLGVLLFICRCNDRLFPIQTECRERNKREAYTQD